MEISPRLYGIKANLKGKDVEWRGGRDVAREGGKEGRNYLGYQVHKKAGNSR